MSQLELLKKLESTIESFLDSAVEMEKEHIKKFSTIDMLDDIARDSLKGRFVNNRLGDWFAKNRDALETKMFDKKDLTTIGNHLDDIKKGFDESDPGTRKLTNEIDDWRHKGIGPNRRFVLKLTRKAEENNLLEKFNAMLGKELSHLDSGEFEGRHLLSVLDDVLKSAEYKEDIAFIHLAGSMIYFLKMNGYKVTPFVKRLKDIENKRLYSKDGDGHV